MPKDKRSFLPFSKPKKKKKQNHSLLSPTSALSSTTFRPSPPPPPQPSPPSPSSPTSSSISSVESILNYSFRNKSLLEAALTHSSHSDSPSYQRLEFIGDAALGLALANFVFIAYPDLDPGQLSLLRAANISTEKLARVAVRHGLYKYVRHNAYSLDQKVSEFALAMEEEGGEILPYGGAVKAPKILADIVESVAAAVYVDCNFDLKLMWEYFSPLLEPIVTMENIEQQPVTMLYEICHKQGKNVNFKNWRKDEKAICNVYVDEKLVGSGYSDQKDTAKLNAAKNALQNLHGLELLVPIEDVGGDVYGMEEIDAAKQKLNELCHKKHWPKPSYRVEQEVGPAHDRKFICSVYVETIQGIYVTSGDMKGRIKDAESSAALMMLHGLKDTNGHAR